MLRCGLCHHLYQVVSERVEKCKPGAFKNPDAGHTSTSILVFNFLVILDQQQPLPWDGASEASL